MFDFIKKALGDREGFSYRGDTFGFGASLDTDMTLFYKLYKGNTDLKRCVEELFQTTGKDGYTLKIGGEPIQSELIDEILDYEYGFNNFKAIIIRDLQVAGNVFIIPIYNQAGSQILGFQILDPRTIRIIANKHGEVIKYMQIRGGNKIEFNQDELLHFKDSIDPDNELFGMSKVETLSYDISADSEAGRSNYSFFKNNAIPSTIITLEGNNPEEVKNALDQLRKQFSGGANSHKISASQGIKDIKQIGATMKDMEFVALRHFTTERICSALGVPKTILGYSDNVNFSTSDNQYRKYIENTIRPLQSQLDKIFNKLIGLIDDKIVFKFIDGHIFDLDNKIARFEKLINIGVITINEAREELGYEGYEDDISNRPVIKQGYELLEDVGLNEVAEPLTNDDNASK